MLLYKNRHLTSYISYTVQSVLQSSHHLDNKGGDANQKHATHLQLKLFVITKMVSVYMFLFNDFFLFHIIQFWFGVK